MKLNYYLCVLLLNYFTTDVSSKQAPNKVRESGLENLVHSFNDKISGFENLVHRLDNNAHRQNQEIKELKEQIETLTIVQQNEAETSDKYHFTPGTYMKSTYGCLSDELTLTCPSGQTILVDKAQYGEYFQGCTSTCCTPHPYDCIESMITSSPEQWVVLKLACDNQTSCSYLHQGATFLQSCTLSSLVDYVEVYYTCLPVSATEPVGFTASATASPTYSVDDIVIFDFIHTNIGNYYNPLSGIFICPTDGTYIFGINVVSTTNNVVTLHLMKESSAFTSAYGDNVEGAFQTGSTTSIFECNTGERVWIRCSASGSILHAGPSGFCSFYGYLLHRK